MDEKIKELNKNIKDLNLVIKRANSLNIPVVAGGPYPTQYFDQIEGVDHFVLGEAESGVLEAFFNDFENSRAKKVYVRHVIRKREGAREIDLQFLDDLISFFGKENSDIQVVEERPSMSLSPIPRFDLLKTNAYMSMALQESRGCPHDCEFCNEGTLFGHQPRLKESDKMIEELEAIYKLGFRGSIFYVDDNFIGNRKKIKERLPKIIKFQKKYGYPFALYTQTDISLALDDVLDADNEWLFRRRRHGTKKELDDAIADAIECYPAKQCANYFNVCGYKPE